MPSVYDNKFYLSAASAFKKQRLSAFHVTWFFSSIASWRNAISSLSRRSPSSSSNDTSSMVLQNGKKWKKNDLLVFWVKTKDYYQIRKKKIRFLIGLDASHISI